MTADTNSTTNSPSTSRAMLWTGRVLSWLPGLLLLVDGLMKIVPPEIVITESAKAGYARETLLPLGLSLVIGVLLYLYPKTSVLGAIVITGYLGGAVATHVILKDPLGSVLFPVVFGAVLWLGLVLKDARLRSLLPVRASVPPRV